MHNNQVVFKDEARAPYVKEGNVDWGKVSDRFRALKDVKVSLGNKHFTPRVREWAEGLSPDQQQRLLDVMAGGLSNEDASVGVYATRPSDYSELGRYLEPIIREYHNIAGDVAQAHDWNIPVGVYDLRLVDPSLSDVSMRARVARNVSGWNLPSSMDKSERVKFEEFMVGSVFSKLPFAGKYYSLTPGHSCEIPAAQADEMRRDRYLFNDMTSDNHLTSSGIASDWPHGRGIWLSSDKKMMVWVGEEDHLRIISIVHGSDLGVVDRSLSTLLSAMTEAGIEFATDPKYGFITTCPTNMGTGKRQSVLLQFPNLSKQGTDESGLKAAAKGFGLQARGLSGEHSQMDAAGTADISPLARFGVTEAEVTKRLFEGLKKLIELEKAH